jgi:hypothetical protein
MDGGRFRIEPWNGESENADATKRRHGRFVGEGPFLWFVSFGPAKEMNSRDSAKAFDLDLFFSEVKGFRLKASYFLCWCKESNQRKHQSTNRRHERRVAPAFSDSASCLDPKTAAIHGGRPPGVQKSPEVAASKVKGIKALAALRLPDQ